MITMQDRPNNATLATVWHEGNLHRAPDAHKAAPLRCWRITLEDTDGNRQHGFNFAPTFLDMALAKERQMSNAKNGYTGWRIVEITETDHPTSASAEFVDVLTNDETGDALWGLMIFLSADRQSRYETASRCGLTHDYESLASVGYVERGATGYVLTAEGRDALKAWASRQ